MSRLQDEERSSWSEMPKSKKRKLIFLGAFVLVDLLLVAVMFLMPRIEYANANRNVRKGNYEEAILQYADLGDYKEAEQRLKVVQGLAAMQEGKTAPGIAYIVEQGLAVEVVFDPGEGRMVQVIPDNTVRYQGNAAQVQLPEAEKEGYQFQQWDVRELFYKAGKSDTVNADLVASFTTIKYAIHYEGGDGMDNPNPLEYDCESPAIILKAPTWKGYNFLGWTWEGQESPTMTAQIEKGSKGEKTFTANWEGLTYQVTMDPNGGTVSPKVKTVTMGQPANLPTPVLKGYAFQGWSQGGLLINSNSAWCVSEDTTVKAMWKAKNYTITLDANGGICSSKSVAVTYDATYSLPTPTREGFEFQGWYAGDTKYTGGVWKTDGNLTLKAVWKGQEFTVTLDPNGGTVSSKTVKVTMGESASLPTPTYTGYKFLGWYTAKTGGERITSGSAWNIAKDTTLYARWEKLQEYTLTINPDGGSYGGNTTVVVISGQTVPLGTPTKEGYVFKGWSVSGVGTVNGNTFTAGDGNATVTASWQAKETPPVDPPAPPASPTDVTPAT